MQIIKKKRKTLALDEIDAKLIRRIKDEKLTYLSKNALQLLLDAIDEINENDVKGNIVETGCALGGSSILLGLNRGFRKLYVYDSFEGMPKPTEKDTIISHKRFEEITSGISEGINDEKYYGYHENLLDVVIQNFKKFNLVPKPDEIEFVKGWYEQTLYVHYPIALAHIDCDWYSSTLVALQRIEPHLQIGGIIIIDDYNHYAGCKRAIHEYFIDKQHQYEFVNQTRLLIRKLK